MMPPDLDPGYSHGRCIGPNKRYGGRSSVGRAPDCDSGCRGFKSRRSPHCLKRGV